MIIWWFFTNWIAQVVYLLAGLWFLNGLRKVFFKPRIKIVSFTRTKAGEFVDVERQQLAPPWLTLKEVWWRGETYDDFVRETDGLPGDAARFGPDVDLSKMIASALRVKKAREIETEELLKEEARRAN